jgi:hypothetical protein
VRDFEQEYKITNSQAKKAMIFDGFLTIMFLPFFQQSDRIMVQ